LGAQKKKIRGEKMYLESERPTFQVSAVSFLLARIEKGIADTRVGLAGRDDEGGRRKDHQKKHVPGVYRTSISRSVAKDTRCQQESQPNGEARPDQV